MNRTRFAVLLGVILFNLFIIMGGPRWQPAYGGAASAVCFRSIGCLRGDPTGFLFMDKRGVTVSDPADGIYQTGEKILSLNMPETLNGEETVHGTLTTQGDLEVQGPGTTERMLAMAYSGVGLNTSGNCLSFSPARNAKTCGQGATNAVGIRFATNMTFTKVCVFALGTNNMIGSETATIQWEINGGATVFGEIVMAATGGEVGVNGSYCEPTIVSAYTANQVLVVQVNETGGDIDIAYYVTAIFGYE